MAVEGVDGQSLLTARQRTGVGRHPVKANQPQQALDEPGRLSERHAEKHPHRKARLDIDVAVDPLAAAIAARHSIPVQRGVEPDRQRAEALERLIVGWLVPGLVDRGCRSALTAQLPR